MPTPETSPPDAAAAYEAHAASFLRTRDASLVGSRVVAQPGGRFLTRGQAPL